MRHSRTAVFYDLNCVPEKFMCLRPMEKSAVADVVS